MKIKLLMMETTTSFSDQTKLDCASINSLDDEIQDDVSFYDSIRFRLDDQLTEPSSDTIRYILKYSNERK